VGLSQPCTLCIVINLDNHHAPNGDVTFSSTSFFSFVSKLRATIMDHFPHPNQPPRSLRFLAVQTRHSKCQGALSPPTPETMTKWRIRRRYAPLLYSTSQFVRFSPWKAPASLGYNLVGSSSRSNGRRYMHAVDLGFPGSPDQVLMRGRKRLHDVEVQNPRATSVNSNWTLDRGTERHWTLALWFPLLTRMSFHHCQVCQRQRTFQLVFETYEQS
jgi:hypothetical protein